MRIYTPVSAGRFVGLYNCRSRRACNQPSRQRAQHRASQHQEKHAEFQSHVEEGAGMQAHDHEEREDEGGSVSKKKKYDRQYDQAIFSLSIPAVLAMATDPLLQLVDTIFVGTGSGSQSGSLALAALGVTSSLLTFAFVTFNFLATATTPLVATALACGDTMKAGKVTVQAFALASSLGILLTITLVFTSDTALSWVGQESVRDNAAVFSLAKEFLLIRALGAPASLLMTVGQGVFRGLQDMRTPLTITLAANGINLALDVVLILGLGWGVKGAGIATCTAEWLAAASYLFLLLWTRRRDVFGGLIVGEGQHQRDQWVRWLLEAFRLQDIAPFFAAGGAVLMRTALLLGTKTLASASAARLGSEAVAGHHIVMQLWILSSLIIDSFAVAGQSLIASELGVGNFKDARGVAHRLMQLGVMTGGFMAAALFVMEPQCIGLFTHDETVRQYVESIYPLAVGALPLNALVYVLDGVLVGARDFSWMAGAMVVAAVASGGLLTTVSDTGYDDGLGLKGVWIALVVLMASRLVMLVWRYVDGPLTER
jgi:putative MATE family efflux protein